MGKALPCPWCGETPLIRQEIGMQTVYRVFCGNENCSVHAQTNWYYTADNALAAWNRRHND